MDVRKATAEEMNTVYTEFQQDGTLVQYAEKGKGWGGRNREELWRSHSSKCENATDRRLCNMSNHRQGGPVPNPNH